MKPKILAINLPNLDLSYFTKRGLEFDVTHVTLDVKFPLKFLYTTVNGDMFTPDIHNYLDINYPKYEYSFVLYGYPQAYYGDALKSTGGYAHHTPIKSGTYWASVRLDGEENKYAVHELHHLLCHYINITLKDITPKDFMDFTPVNGSWVPYYKNWSPEESDSNHAQTWANIVPFLPRLKSITYNDRLSRVLIKRAYGDDKQQLGDLSIGGFKCKTLELSWKDNKKNISCIPKGKYNAKRKFSIKFGWVYEIQNVPGRSGILIHAGNTFFDIQGCILLGDMFGDVNKDKHADILNSKKTVKAFEEFMNKEPFILEII